MNINTVKPKFTQMHNTRSKDKEGMGKNEKKPQTDDIFLKMPLRALAYSNEVGAALEPLIGHSAALMTYFPAMLYIGADCYDKYLRGETNDYQQPSAACLAKEAVFQGLASVLMPTLAIHAGQNLACGANRFLGDKIDARAKNEVSVFLKEHALNFDLVKDKEAAFDEVSKNIFDKIKNYRDSKQSSNGPIKKYWKKFTSLFNEALSDKSEFKHCGKIDPKDPSYAKLSSFAKKQFDEMYDLMKSLESCDTGSIKGIMDSMEKSGKKISKYKATKFFNKIQKYAKDPSIGTDRAKKLAIVDMAREDINMKSLKGGPLLIAVVAGFATLFAVGPLIDKFCEEIVAKKIVDPMLEYGKRFKQAFIATNESYKKTPAAQSETNSIMNEKKADALLA